MFRRDFVQKLIKSIRSPATHVNAFPTGIIRERVVAFVALAMLQGPHENNVRVSLILAHVGTPDALVQNSREFFWIVESAVLMSFHRNCGINPVDVEIIHFNVKIVNLIGCTVD